jgi:hypothetical protein
MVLVEVFGADELQDGVAQVFEALVVAGRKVRALVGERAVGDRLEQQARVTEVDSNFLLEQL